MCILYETFNYIYPTHAILGSSFCSRSRPRRNCCRVSILYIAIQWYTRIVRLCMVSTCFFFHNHVKTFLKEILKYMTTHYVLTAPFSRVPRESCRLLVVFSKKIMRMVVFTELRLFDRNNNMFTFSPTTMPPYLIPLCQISQILLTLVHFVRI